MISGRKASAAMFQGPRDRRLHNEAETLEDIIMTEKGVQATVKVTDERVTIRTTDYRDYVMAAAAIRGRVSQPIFQA